MTSKINENSELLVSQHEATEFAIFRNKELEEAKLVRAKIISMKAKFKNFRIVKQKYFR